jgi:hypothetical protein
MQREQAQQIVNELRALDYNRDGLEAFQSRIQQLESGGWKLSVSAYSRKVYRAKRGRRLALRRPRVEWRNGAAWVNGRESIWYYDNPATSKYEALQTRTNSGIVC